MIQTIKKQWFLVSLVLVFMAVVFDQSNNLAKFGMMLKNNHGPDIIIFFIFIFSGLLIESDQIIAGIRDIKSTVLALSVILLFAPLAALILSFFPLDTSVIVGLFIVAVMPTTLSSGIVMTGTAGGNMAHALFVTILSNFIGIFSIPVILSFLLSFINQEKELIIDQGAITAKLLLVCPFSPDYRGGFYFSVRSKTDPFGAGGCFFQYIDSCECFSLDSVRDCVFPC